MTSKSDTFISEHSSFDRFVVGQDKPYKSYGSSNISKNYKMEKFTDNEVKRIRDASGFKIGVNDMHSNIHIYSTTKKMIGYIRKYSDEYYLVFLYYDFYTPFYFCDQFRGLLEFLKDYYDFKSRAKNIKENVNNKLYKSYDTGSIGSAVKKFHREEFTTQEIQKIQNVIKYEIRPSGKHIDIYCIIHNFNNQKIEKMVGYIIKYSDEYYLVCMYYRSPNHYVCDQFEGLVELFKDCKIFKSKSEDIKESIESKPYKRYDRNEIGNVTRKYKNEKFTINEVKRIQEISKLFDIREKGPCYDLFLYSKDDRYGPSSVIGYIKKYSDEYYLVKFNYTDFYFCDQFKGLLEFLKDLQNINSIKENVENKLYKKYDNMEQIYQVMATKTREAFNIKESNYIRKLNPLYDFVLTFSGMTIDIFKKYDIHVGYIHKYSDEYYILTVINNRNGRNKFFFYVCDQLEGLKDCLESVYTTIVKENVEDKLYKKYDDYYSVKQSMSTKTKEEFSRKELNDVHKLIPQYKLGLDITKSSITIFKDDHIQHIGYINKYSDEYYILDIVDHKRNKFFFYVCDQFKGLENCLKDLGATIIKENKQEKPYVKYTLPSYGDLNKKINKLNKENFTDKEFKNISNLIEYPIRLDKSKTTIDILNHKENFRVMCYITKYSDEYYLVANYSSDGYYYHDAYYLCDQFKGVIEFLKDHFNKKIIKENAENKPYEKYTSDDLFRKLKNLHGEKFTTKEIKEIKILLSHVLRMEIYYGSIHVTDRLYSMQISKYSDEYYLVRYIYQKPENGGAYTSDHYLCDQFNGLVEFLKERFNNKIIKESKENKLYKEYNENELYNILQKRNLSKEIFKEQEVLKIERTIGHKFRSIKFQHNRNKSMVDILNPKMKQKENFPVGYITKYSDEYYEVCMYYDYEEYYYLCDGFEGLLQFLRDHFNDIIKESREDKPYKKYTYTELVNTILKNLTCVSFNVREIEKIRNLFNNIEIKFGSTVITTHLNGFIVQVEKFEDEYYLVSVTKKVPGIHNLNHYLCDQFNGLVEFFKDHFSSNINESKEEKLYKEYTGRDLNKTIRKLGREFFTEQEIQKIKNLYPTEFIKFGLNHTKSILDISTKESMSYTEVGYVVKYSDEYYVVSLYSCDKYYLCDQYEGFIQFLKDNFISQNESINEHKEENKLYEPIQRSNLDKRIENLNKEEFSILEKEKLKELFPNCEVNSSLYYLALRVENDYNIKMDIQKYNDEWYVIYAYIICMDNKINNQYYLCDSFQGVLNCAKDITKESINEHKQDKSYHTMEKDVLRDKIKNLSTEYFHIREIQRLKEIFPNYRIEESKYSKGLLMENEEKYIMIVLDKYSDEWYIVTPFLMNTEEVWKARYVCDQFEGLINCLKDILKISPVNEHKENELYEPVNKNIIDDKTKNLSYVRFTNKEIEIIKNSCPQDYNIIENGHLIYISNTNSDNILKIYKYSDEWYCVFEEYAYPEKYYLCDQLEGLLNFLKDEQNGKIIF